MKINKFYNKSIWVLWAIIIFAPINNIYSMQRVENIIKNTQHLAAFVKLKKAGINDINLQKLTIIANLLFYQKLQLNALRWTLPLFQEIIDNSSDKEIVYSRESSTAITNSDKIVIPIESSCTKVLYDYLKQKIKKIESTNNFEVGNNITLEAIEYLNRLIKSNTDQNLICMAKDFKNFFYKLITSNTLGYYNVFTAPLIQLILYIDPDKILLMQKDHQPNTDSMCCTECLRERAEVAYSNNNSYELIEKWLTKADLIIDIDKIIPELLEICKKTNDIHIRFKSIPKSNSSQKIECISDLRDQIVSTIAIFQERQSELDQLYKDIMDLATYIVKNSKLNVKEKSQYKKIITKFLLNFDNFCYSDLPSSIDDNNPDFIKMNESILGLKNPEAPSIQEKKEGLNKKQKKNNIQISSKQSTKARQEQLKRSKKIAAKVERKRLEKLHQEKIQQEQILQERLRQEEIEQERLEQIKSEQEHQKYLDEEFHKFQPIYDSRIIQWLYKEFTQEELLNDKDTEHNKSILYHTYSPLVDLFVQKYGRQETFINRDQRSDIRHYMLGIIKTQNSENINVRFDHTCSSLDGLCYHRGFLKDIVLFISANNKKNLFKKLKTKKLVIKINDSIYREQEYQENNNIILIKDRINQVELILIKNWDLLS